MKHNLSIEVCFGEILNAKSGEAIAKNTHYNEVGNNGEFLTALAIENSELTKDEFRLAKKVLTPIFNEFDTSQDKNLDVGELKLLIKSTFDTSLSHDEAQELHKAATYQEPQIRPNQLLTLAL